MFLQGPALWLYIKSLSTPSFRFRAVYLLHFLPFLFFASYQYFSFYHLPVQEKIHIVSTNRFKDFIFYKISVIAIAISAIVYNLWALQLLKKHRNRLKQALSKIEDIDLNWLRTLIMASLVCYGVNVTLFNLDLIFHFGSYQILMLIAYSFAAVFVLLLGYFGLRQRNVFINYSEPKAVSQPTNPHSKSLPDKKPDSHKIFAERLLTYTKEQKPYLEPEITVSMLSKQLNVKPEFLSETLNNRLKQNFFDFINRYRIKEFKEKSIAKENSHLTIMGIAYDCGFNSKASFYRAFKKFEGISPTAYIRSVSHKSETHIPKK